MYTRIGRPCKERSGAGAGTPGAPPVEEIRKKIREQEKRAEEEQDATLREDRWGLSGPLAVIILPFRRLILNLFAGVFGTDLFSRVLFSYGAQARLFLPARLIVEAYVLNAS